MPTVRYSCPECGLLDQTCRVPPRPKDQDVVVWMQEVCIQAVAADHALRSPVCNARLLTNLKIPIDKDGPDVYIGKETSIVPPAGPKDNP